MWLTLYCRSIWRVWSASCWVTLLRDAAPKMVLVLMCPLRPNGCLVMGILFLLFDFTLCGCSDLFHSCRLWRQGNKISGDTPRPGRGLRSSALLEGHPPDVWFAPRQRAAARCTPII